MPAFQMGGLGRQIGLISAFSQGHSSAKEQPRAGSRSQVSDPSTFSGNSPDVPGSTRARKCHQALGEKNVSNALGEDWGTRGPPTTEAVAAPSVHGRRGTLAPRTRAVAEGRGGGEGPAEQGFTYHRSPP